MNSWSESTCLIVVLVSESYLIIKLNNTRFKWPKNYKHEKLIWPLKVTKTKKCIYRIIGHSLFLLFNFGHVNRDISGKRKATFQN